MSVFGSRAFQVSCGREFASHRRARAGSGLVATILLAVALAACGGSSSPSSSTGASANVAKQTSSGGGTVVSGPGGTVRIRSIDDLDTFDPAKTGAPNMAVQAIE